MSSEAGTSLCAEQNRRSEISSAGRVVSSFKQPDVSLGMASKINFSFCGTAGANHFGGFFVQDTLLPPCRIM